MFTGCCLVSLTMPMPYLYHYIILYLCKIQNEIPLNLVNSYNLMRKNHEQHRKNPWNPILNPYNTHRRFFLGAPVPQMHLLQGIPANRFGGTEQVKRKNINYGKESGIHWKHECLMEYVWNMFHITYFMCSIFQFDPNISETHGNIWTLFMENTKQPNHRIQILGRHPNSLIHGICGFFFYRHPHGMVKAMIWGTAILGNLPWKFIGWWFGTMEFYDFPIIYWEFHHPNSRTPWFFRGVGISPTSLLFKRNINGIINEY